MNLVNAGQSDRLLGCLLGAVAGLLFSCCLGVGGLMLVGESSPASAPSSPQARPEAYDIQAIIEEDYINRTMVQNAARIPSPMSVVAGHLDIRPGGQADFTVQMDAGPLRPVFKGTIEMRATEAGELEIALVQVLVGNIPVTALVPADQFASVNESVNQQLVDRAAAAGSELRVAGVTTDDTSLHLYLVALSN